MAGVSLKVGNDRYFDYYDEYSGFFLTAESIDDYYDYINSINNGKIKFKLDEGIDPSNCEYEVKRITINDINDQTIELIKHFSSSLEELNFNSLNLNQINYVLNSANISDDVEIQTKYNHYDSSTKSEIEDVIYFIHNIRDYVFQFDLSEFEQSIFVFDLLREREYKMDKEELQEHISDISKSRSLMKVYNNSAIVCLGFANMYMAVLESLGINCDVIIYDNEKKDESHANNIIHIKDEKYNMDQFLVVDPTLNRSETNSGNYSYRGTLSNYLFFGYSMDEYFNYCKKNENLIYSEFEQLFKSIEMFNHLIELHAPQIIFKSGLNSVIERIKDIKEKYSTSIFDKEYNKLTGIATRFLKHDLNDIFISRISNSVNNILENYKESLSPQVFFDAMKVVKQTEHQINNHKYPYNDKFIRDCCLSRFRLEEMQNIFLLDAVFKDEKGIDTSYIKDMEVNVNPFMAFTEEKTNSRK